MKRVMRDALVQVRLTSGELIKLDRLSTEFNMTRSSYFQWLLQRKQPPKGK